VKITETNAFSFRLILTSYQSLPKSISFKRSKTFPEQHIFNLVTTPGHVTTWHANIYLILMFCFRPNQMDGRTSNDERRRWKSCARLSRRNIRYDISPVNRSRGRYGENFAKNRNLISNNMVAAGRAVTRFTTPLTRLG